MLLENIIFFILKNIKYKIVFDCQTHFPDFFCFGEQKIIFKNSSQTYLYILEIFPFDI